jgi:uncharacterized membrane protein YozB (DUF420 family)
MSALIALVVAGGFGRTLYSGLIHPPYPMPLILYVHTAVFTGWVVLFLVQTGLVQSQYTRSHRILGRSSLALAVPLPIIGVWVAIAMARLEIQHGDQSADVLIPFCDMLYFTLLFGLGFWWRRSPETHRRLMLVAAISLTSAAFGRYPHFIVPRGWFYLGVDSLIVIGMVRDLLVQRRVHPVYQIGLPLMACGQIMASIVRHTTWWHRVLAELLNLSSA